jgi:iron complex outermembrane receptor protein
MNKKYSILMGSLLCLPGLQGIQAADDESRMEEVIVTGSYLKRSAADSPSPLSVISSADIEDIGAADASEIIQAMPWASGSQTRATTFGGEGADGRNSVNLRNLGNASTLPLVNGKRQVASWYNGRGNASVNVNGLVPNIALERVEVIKDGASALYGSDAVAGVVNFITKKDFEGMDIQTQFTTDEHSGNGDATTIGAIWGVQGDRGGIVFSASVLNRDEINVEDRYERYGGSTISSTGQPGRVTPIAGQVPTWAANGLRPGQAVDRAIDGIGATGGATDTLPRNAAGTDYGQADVNCEDSAALEQGGALGNIFNRCVYDFGSFFSIQAEESLRKMHVDGHYDVTDDFNVYFEAAANDSEFNRLNSLNPNAPALTIPTDVQYIDAAGMVQTAPNPGSHEDAFRRGIEPIQMANLTRMMGGTRNTPASQRPLKSFTNTNRSDSRYVLGGSYDFAFGDKEWVLDASYTATQHSTGSTQVQDTLSSHMELAINGLGGPNCDVQNGVPGSGNTAYSTSGGDFDAGACYFFNPFGNGEFDRAGNVGQTDLGLRNPAELYNWLQGRASNDSDFRQRVIDVVAAGDLFETDSGSVGIALGFQQRRDSAQVLYDSSLTSNNLDFVYGAQDWQGGLTTTAFFAEIGIPVGENLDINFAVRYEEFDELNVDTTDPKLSILWRPTDTLSVRLSGGTSFRVPSLLQSFGQLTTVRNQVDHVQLGGTAYKPSLTVGNPDLTPETAENYNIGFSWIPQDGLLEGLAIDLDYYNYEYSDIITRQSGPVLLTEDNNALDAYVAANPGSSLLDAVNAGAGNRAQIIRNSQGFLTRLLPGFSNANGATVSGVDMTTSYSFSTGFGDWKVGALLAYVNEYEVEVPNSNGVGSTIVDGVGSLNTRNEVARALPEFTLNGTLNWSMDNHRVFVIVKHIDELATDIPAGTRGFYAAVAPLAGNGHNSADFRDEIVESMTTIDVQYSYNFGETAFLSDSNVTIGIMNLTDEIPPLVSDTTGYFPTLHDGRGRMFFVRAGVSL